MRLGSPSVRLVPPVCRGSCIRVSICHTVCMGKQTSLLSVALSDPTAPECRLFPSVQANRQQCLLASLLLYLGREAFESGRRGFRTPLRRRPHLQRRAVGVCKCPWISLCASAYKGVLSGKAGVSLSVQVPLPSSKRTFSSSSILTTTHGERVYCLDLLQLLKAASSLDNMKAFFHPPPLSSLGMKVVFFACVCFCFLSNPHGDCPLCSRMPTTSFTCCLLLYMHRARVCLYPSL